MSQPNTLSVQLGRLARRVEGLAEVERRRRGAHRMEAVDTLDGLSPVRLMLCIDPPRHEARPRAALEPVPSLGEGFGRVGLEAMELGVPLACSDLPVLHEVLGDYPEYFNPLRVEEIVESFFPVFLLLI